MQTIYVSLKQQGRTATEEMGDEESVKVVGCVLDVKNRSSTHFKFEQAKAACGSIVSTLFAWAAYTMNVAVESFDRSQSVRLSSIFCVLALFSA